MRLLFAFAYQGPRLPNNLKIEEKWQCGVKIDEVINFDRSMS